MMEREEPEQPEINVEQMLSDKTVNNETLELISAGQFKLDFQPAFDIDREKEIKLSLQEKIKNAKQLEENHYRYVIISNKYGAFVVFSIDVNMIRLSLNKTFSILSMSVFVYVLSAQCAHYRMKNVFFRMKEKTSNQFIGDSYFSCAHSICANVTFCCKGYL